MRGPYDQRSPGPLPVKNLQGKRKGSRQIFHRKIRAEDLPAAILFSDSPQPPPSGLIWGRFYSSCLHIPVKKGVIVSGQHLFRCLIDVLSKKIISQFFHSTDKFPKPVPVFGVFFCQQPEFNGFVAELRAFWSSPFFFQRMALATSLPILDICFVTGISNHLAFGSIFCDLLCFFTRGRIGAHFIISSNGKDSILGQKAVLHFFRA